MSNFLRHVGLDPDSTTVELTTSEIHANHSGLVQGGVLATMLDMACGNEVGAGLPEGKRAATVTLTVTYLRPGKIGSTLTATASTLHRGDSLVMVEGDVQDDEGNKIAHAAATFTVIDAA